MDGESATDSDSNLYENLFNNSHSVMLIIHPSNGAILDANTKACNYYGYSHDKITSMKIMDINTLSEKSVHNEMQKAKTKNKT